MAQTIKRSYNFRPNFLFYWMLNKFAQNRKRLDPAMATAEHPEGQKSIVKFFNFGGSRSAKSFDTIHLIIKFCSDYSKIKPLKIDVYRSELIDAKDLTLEDFKLCFSSIGYENGIEYELVGDSQSGRPEIRIWGSTIYFKGYPAQDKEAGFCDIAWINEVLEKPNRKDAYNSIKKRCSMLLICDGNPKYTTHWAFEQEGDFNAFYSETSYLDNFHLPNGIAAERESKCPWDFADSHIEIRDYFPTMKPGWNGTFHNGFRVRVWDKPEMPDNITEDKNNEYRRPNKINVERGTVDKFDYLVYSEGKRAAKEGAVFDNVRWISSFPDAGFDEVCLGMDFGYKADNTTLERVGRIGNDKATIECMFCQPTATPEICFFGVKDALLREVERRKREGISNADELWIVCESQDNSGTELFVDGLNQLAASHGYNWNFYKVVKKSILAGVSIMKSFKLTLVRHPRFEIEQQNYCYRYQNGIPTNEPDPQSQFCDIWDGARYVFQTYFYWKVENTTK